MDISLIIGVVGVIIGIIGLALYLRDRRNVELRYEFINDTLIGDSAMRLPDDITVYFRDRPLRNLKKSNLVVWNTGNQSILASGFARPITVVFPTGTEILSVRVAKQSIAENAVMTEIQTGTSVKISLAFLSVQHGFNVEFLHSSPDGAPRAEATLIDSPNGLVDNRDRQPRQGWRRYVSINGLIGGTFGVVGVLLWEHFHGVEIQAIMIVYASFGLPVVVMLMGFNYRLQRDGKQIPSQLITETQSISV